MTTIHQGTFVPKSTLGTRLNLTVVFNSGSTFITGSEPRRGVPGTVTV